MKKTERKRKRNKFVEDLEDKTDSKKLKKVKKLKKLKTMTVSFRSSFNGILIIIDSFLNESKITKEHTECFNETPFGRFIGIFLDKRINEEMTKKSYKSITGIINSFREEEDGFVFGNSNKVVRITPEFISMLFGISMSGYKTDICGKFSTSTDFEKRHFGERARENVVRKTTVEKLLKDQVSKSTREDTEDFVKLFIIYCWATFFNPQAGGTIPRAFISNVSTIKMINTICWPRVLCIHLLKILRKFHSKPTSVSGCVYILLYLLAEHTRISKPIEGRENSEPRFMKWKLDNLAYSSLQKITDDDVLNEIKQYSEEEKKLLIANEAMEVLSDESEEEDVKQKKPDLEEENINLLKMKEELTKQNMEIKKVCEKFEKEKLTKEEERKAFEVFEVEKKNLENHVDVLFKQIEELVEKKSNLENEMQIKEVAISVEEVKKKVEDLEKEKNNLQNRLHQALTQVNFLMKEKMDLQKEVEQLKKSLDDLQRGNDAGKHDHVHFDEEVVKNIELKESSMYEPCSREKLEVVMKEKVEKMLNVQLQQELPVEKFIKIAQVKVKEKRDNIEQSLFTPIELQQLETLKESRYWSTYT